MPDGFRYIYPRKWKGMEKTTRMFRLAVFACKDFCNFREIFLKKGGKQTKKNLNRSCRGPRPRYPLARMPPTEEQDGDHDGRKLQHAEKDFVTARVTAHPLGRLGHAEDGSQIDE